MPLNPPQAQVPIGFVVIDNKRYPVEINAPGWYRYLTQQLFDRVGGSFAPTNQELNEMSRSTMVEDDDEGSVEFIPGPRGDAGEAGQQGPATFLLHEGEHVEHMQTMPSILLALAALGGGDAGKYTPTLTNVANLDASTAYEWMYMRLGAIVLTGGRVDVDPTAGSASTQLGFSLPVASNIGAVEDVSGVAFAPGIAGQGAAVLGDAANNRGQIEFISANTTNQAMYAVCIYEVI